MDGFLDTLALVVEWMREPIYLGDGYVTSFWEVVVFGVVGGITVKMISEFVNGFE